MRGCARKRDWSSRSIAITVQIDIAFGDRVVPRPVEIDFTTLLDLPGPHLRA